MDDSVSKQEQGVVPVCPNLLYYNILYIKNKEHNIAENAKVRLNE